MANKYAKHVITDQKLIKMDFAQRLPFFHLKGVEQWPGLNCQIAVAPIAAPLLMEDKPMKHDFDQILCFLGADPNDVFKFEAEVELSLGDEQEIQRITTPSVVYIPKGLTHCPINFKRISKPILFLDITLTSAYTRKEKTADGWSGIVRHEDISAADAKRFGVKE